MRIFMIICFMFSLCDVLKPQIINYSLRFHGNGVDDIDRVKIQIDTLSNSSPGPPADIGAEDFTIDFWLKANQTENQAGAITCGDNYDWIDGNIVFDRDRFNQNRAFGMSIAGGVITFGINGQDGLVHTVCGTTNILDANWHHIAVQRRRTDGWMWLFVDGILEAQADGPDGDISYPDNGIPCSDCCGNLPTGPSCNDSDPFIVLGAEKHDAGSPYPSFSGWLDEVRLSNILRYTDDFTPPSNPFVPDTNTVALYHFDEGQGDVIHDSSGAVGGPSDGIRKFGGTPAGPEWSTDSPFNNPVPITLGFFIARVTANGFVALEWKTFTETNNFGFAVQRRNSAESGYVTLPNSFVPGNHTTTVPHIYSFLDTTVTPGHWSYRLKQIDLDGTVNFHDEIHIDVNVDKVIPEGFALHPNYPNPFNAGTSIRFDVPFTSHVQIKIFSILGKEVKTLLNQSREPGSYFLNWDGTDNDGKEVPSGVYYYEMRAASFGQTRKLILLK